MVEIKLKGETLDKFLEIIEVFCEEDDFGCPSSIGLIDCCKNKCCAKCWKQALLKGDIND